MRQEVTDYFVHESSYVDDGARVGNGTKIWHFSHIMRGAAIGNHCTIGQNVNVSGKAVIGNYCKLQNNISVYDGVIMEDKVFCGPSCVFTNVLNPRAFVERKNEYRETRVEEGTTIGANATILCGVTLGRYSFIGAGAVVTGDVAAFSLVTGVPASHRGWVSRAGERLDASLVCPRDGERYELIDDGQRLRPVVK